MLWTSDSLRITGISPSDFFTTENLAHADAMEAGVGIDPDRRAYHMFILSGLTDDQINHILRFRVRSRCGRTIGISGSSFDPRSLGMWSDTDCDSCPRWLFKVGCAEW